jgi:uncharacterized protein (DUF849 family)
MSAIQHKVIITCAVTGSVHTPTMTLYLPITPAEIAASAIGAAKAGASIIHLHVRDPRDGRPSADPALYREALAEIKQASHAVINITTGGSQDMTVEERLRAPLDLSPEMASLNLGTMNFALFPVLDKYKEFRFAWEPKFLEGTRSGFFKNTFADIEYILRTLGEGHGTRFEFECYDIGHLYTLAHFAERGIVKPPFFVQSVFGVLGGIGADPDNLLHAKRIADKLFGDAYRWSVLAAGRHQMPLATEAALNGGNVRVGLEDSIYIEKGRLAEKNEDQVHKIRQILVELGLAIATAEEARDMLQLKGPSHVGF